MKTKTLAISIVCLILACSAYAEGIQNQPGWLPGDGIPGINGFFTCTTTWDPDGDGPLPELLVVGGYFTVAGNVLANNIAAWDGTSWHPLGSGINGGVYALTVYNGQLIAGGGFDTAGGIAANSIARWDGTSWQALGSGMYGGVFAITVYNGQLIAGGNFITAGGAIANRIAAWDGKNWKVLGSGINGTVSALTVYNGQLIAGGGFTTAGGAAANGTAAWDGTSWQPLGSGTSGSYSYFNVNALTVYNGQLIAGGSFNTAGGAAANSIAAWDGENWQALGSGVNSSVNTLTVYNGQLIAGGYFTTVGGAEANHIARWDGTSWQALGNGVNSIVRALTVYKGQLIAGGPFTAAGDVVVNNIARWDGTSWQPLCNGMSDFVVYALTVYNGQLIAGGSFTTARGVMTNNIARWDGTSWQPLGSGMNGDVTSLAVYNGQLIAGGKFTTAGGAQANHIARWDGTNWHPLGSGMERGGEYTGVSALTVYNGQLIAGGRFTTAGDANANNIARWDGTTWQPLGSGMSGSSTYNSFSYPFVSALTVYNGQLIAGGSFTKAGDASANNIARWDGTNWQPLDRGVSGGPYPFVSALTVYNGQLIVGGKFTNAGVARGCASHACGIAANNIARWDGTNWQALGSGVNNYIVYALAVYNGRLITEGTFELIDGVWVNHIVAWDGASWQPLGNVRDAMYAPDDIPYVFSLMAYNGRLIVGGNFLVAGDHVSAYLARWGLDSPPLADAGPDQTVYAGLDGIAKVTLDGSDSNSPCGDNVVLTYKWTWTIGADTYEANGVSPTIELPVGIHKITLVVNDGYLNSAADDVNVTVAGPVELLAQLQSELVAMNADKGVLNGLSAKLDTAVKHLADKNVNNNVAAVNAMQAFVNAVSAQRGKKITQQQADDLIGTAQEIIGLLN